MVGWILGIFKKYIFSLSFNILSCNLPHPMWYGSTIFYTLEPELPKEASQLTNY
jgi:hypothetical protein